MSTPIPTEAHIDLALQIAEALARSGNVAAAELIAASEARATAELRDSLALEQDMGNAAYDELRGDADELRGDVVRLTAERDQLRAKAQRFQRLEAFTNTAAAELKSGLITFGGIAGLRAERDELSAKVERLDRAAGAIGEAFGKAEAELAAERARLDWLESDAGVDWQWSSTTLTIRRASIDAAIKETP